MSGTLLEAAAAAALLSSKQEFHYSVYVAPVSTVCASSSRVKLKCFGPAEKQPSMGLKYCLL